LKVENADVALELGERLQHKRKEYCKFYAALNSSKKLNVWSVLSSS
jgi:hypothetical protein